ncbi:hypothetical protein STCU_03487 [Strigomonas culicis]|uniref:Uncharacterized protein n=1 Tax=Strigomonas culicis TaxID=28005 RepID=S9W609_9TRYP|nr:hypothetical protein STCU_03487 [Strigomonas culicis]|eukprot:EPY31375.1 hypothetical protein STCU_03487 [Strigomonas culicis]
MSMERVLEKDFNSLLATHALWWEGVAPAGAEDALPSWVAAAPQMLLPASRRSVPLLSEAQSACAHGGRCDGRVESDSHLAWAGAFVALRRTPPYDSDLTRRRQMQTALCALQATYCDAAPDHVEVLVRLALPL